MRTWISTVVDIFATRKEYCQQSKSIFLNFWMKDLNQNIHITVWFCLGQIFQILNAFFSPFFLKDLRGISSTRVLPGLDTGTQCNLSLENIVDYPVLQVFILFLFFGSFTPNEAQSKMSHNSHSKYFFLLISQIERKYLTTCCYIVLF